MTLKEKLIATIEQSSDSVVEQIWQAIATTPGLTEIVEPSLEESLEPDIGESTEPLSILERMGGGPRHFISNPNLGDRTQRKAAIYQQIQARHNARS
jgi:hypothetical protein